MVLEKPSALPPAREVDFVLVGIVIAMCVLDAIAALQGAKAILIGRNVSNAKPKED